MILYFAMSPYIIIIKFPEVLQMFCLKSKASSLDAASLMEHGLISLSNLSSILLQSEEYNAQEIKYDKMGIRFLCRVRLIQSSNTYHNKTIA